MTPIIKDNIVVNHQPRSIRMATLLEPAKSHRVRQIETLVQDYQSILRQLKAFGVTVREVDGGVVWRED